MLLLAIETSSVRGSLALLRGGECVEEVAFPEGFSYGREVPLRVAELLRSHDAQPGDLEGVAVSVGPGSYTGTRVGVTAAKTLAFALELPVVGVVSLRVLAASVCLAAEAGELGDAPAGAATARVATVLDGRQDFLYGALWEIDLPARGARLAPDLAPAVRALVPQCVDVASGIRTALELAGGSTESEGPVFLVGDGAGKFQEEAERGGTPAAWSRLPAALDVPRASALGRLAARELAEARADPDAAHRLEPVYLRATEAERKLMVRQGELPGDPAARIRHGAPPAG